VSGVDATVCVRIQGDSRGVGLCVCVDGGVGVCMVCTVGGGVHVDVDVDVGAGVDGEVMRVVVDGVTVCSDVVDVAGVAVCCIDDVDAGVGVGGVVSVVGRWSLVLVLMLSWLVMLSVSTLVLQDAGYGDRDIVGGGGVVCDVVVGAGNVDGDAGVFVVGGVVAVVGGYVADVDVIGTNGVVSGCIGGGVVICDVDVGGCVVGVVDCVAGGVSFVYVVRAGRVFDVGVGIDVVVDGCGKVCNGYVGVGVGGVACCVDWCDVVVGIAVVVGGCVGLSCVGVVVFVVGYVDVVVDDVDVGGGVVVLCCICVGVGVVSIAGVVVGICVCGVGCCTYHVS